MEMSAGSAGLRVDMGIDVCLSRMGDTTER